jgi:signal peptidase
MEPIIPMGAAVVAFPVAAQDLRTEQVISVRVGPQKAVFTHRIIRIVEREDGLWLATQGDANPEPDPSLVPASAVIGRVDWQIPDLGFLIALLSSISGVAFVLSLAGFLLAGAWLLETLEDDQRAARRRPTGGLAPGAAA